MRPRLEPFKQLEHAGKEFAFPARQFQRQEMHIAVQERADVFVSHGNVVLFQNAQNDSRIGHARDLDVVQIIINPEALFESQLERLYTRAARMNQRAVDVEKEKAFLRLCHVKRSRDISYCSFAKSQSGARTLQC